jgi:hypothetical protein
LTHIRVNRTRRRRRVPMPAVFRRGQPLQCRGTGA